MISMGEQSRAVHHAQIIVENQPLTDDELT